MLASPRHDSGLIGLDITALIDFLPHLERLLGCLSALWLVLEPPRVSAGHWYRYHRVLSLSWLPVGLDIKRLCRAVRVLDITGMISILEVWGHDMRCNSLPTRAL